MSDPWLHEFTVEDSFVITGRGLVVAGEGEWTGPFGKPLHAEVHRPDGSILYFSAYPELLLVRAHPITERSVFLLRGAAKEEVPTGSVVRIFPEGSPDP